MKTIIIADIQQPIQIHFRDLKRKQIYVTDLITGKDFILTLNLKSQVSMFLMCREGLTILKLSHKKGGSHYHPKLVSPKEMKKIRYQHPEIFI